MYSMQNDVQPMYMYNLNLEGSPQLVTWQLKGKNSKNLRYINLKKTLYLSDVRGPIPVISLPTLELVFII